MTEVNIKPLADRVIVKPDEVKEVTKSGIVLPDTSKEKPIGGIVVAAGPGKVTDEGKLSNMSVKVGDKVLYGKYSGTEIKLDDDEYLIMREEDIFGIVK